MPGQHRDDDELDKVFEELFDDDKYADEKLHKRCPDCKGSGWYTGFLEVKHCPTCDGSGWL